MEDLELDMTGVYAYADTSHARDRELWRGFLSYVLPSIIPCDPEILEKNLAQAVVYSFAELSIGVHKTKNKEKSGTQGQGDVLRRISAMLAKEIGISAEFALASFYEGKVPTKLYRLKQRPLKKSSKVHKEDAMIARWLSSFSRVQADKKFIKLTQKWHQWMDDSNNHSTVEKSGHS
jgi:hypothetical protein